MSVLARTFAHTKARQAERTRLSGSWIASLLAGFRQWRAERAMFGLSDGTLHDLAVSRAEIGYAVRHGRTRPDSIRVR